MSTGQARRGGLSVNARPDGAEVSPFEHRTPVQPISCVVVPRRDSERKGVTPLAALRFRTQIFHMLDHGFFRRRPAGVEDYASGRES
jgi:hypothetical protein